MIANRLPVTAEIRKNGRPSFRPSVGGLATGMSSLAGRYASVWLGYSGIPQNGTARHDAAAIEETLARKYLSYEVPLSQREIDLYYNGFSNKTLWPLFHYFPLMASFDEESWKCYVAVNNRFYERLQAIYEPGDIVWVHDYHLMLLPGIIRQKIPDAKIGFFLHIPFPSYEMFRLIPWRKELLYGLLGSDLIGFHTFGYVRHFLSSVQRVTGLEHSMCQMRIENRMVRCDTFPMGIDYQRYSEYMGNRKILEGIGEYRQSLAGKKMILSMDRLDQTKGIIERLNACERFLDKYREFHGKVQFLIVTVPSRTEIDTYISLRKRINELVGRINGKFNTLSWSPVQYMYRSLPFEMIMTLYHCADVCLVTPMRDGMNLVAKEYVASRVNDDGVLILSEMAGAAEELGEALVVNPNNIEDVADSIAAALAMPEVEQHRRMAIMKRRLRQYDVGHWASSFIGKLSDIRKSDDPWEGKHLTGDSLKEMLDAFNRAGSRLILLDYDGTLISFAGRPDMAVPDDGLRALLGRLAADTRNHVALTSGRNFEFMERWFSTLPATLIAEHGAWFRLRGDVWKTVSIMDTRWKNEIRPVLETYCGRTPGTFIEEKEFSLAWHYRRSDTELASMRVMELKGHLLHMIANHNLGILEENKVLEIKSLEINKGRVVNFILSAAHYDFILAMGDGTTDEDLFAVIPENGYTVKVGYVPTGAGYVVDGVQTVRRVLERLAEV